ncbi:MAG TPA: HAMP domain-containing sensor histidine kinase [Solirubrobacteraceae bacterium]|jgi:two-component system sensor histidine kinase MprB
MRAPIARALTLRTRIAAVASLSVALAVLGAAIGVYVAVRSDLRGQLDSSLRQRAQGFLGPFPVGPPAGRPPAPDRYDDGGFPNSVQPRPYGAPAGYVQFIAPHGAVFVPGGQGIQKRIAPNSRDLRIAASGSGTAIADRTVRGTRLRVLTAGAGPRGAVLVALPLAEVDHELRRLELLLLVIGLVGIALAAGLGSLVARTALAPIARFTKRAERLSGGLDLAQRLDVGQRLPVAGRDELGRLAESFNATLDALARSVDAQRQLIADAGHELRTPIASLRANIQILQEADRLDPAERESLRRDVLDELDELTALIADVIELARGSAPEATRAEVRLDALVLAAVERARRRAGEVRFELDLQPTLVRADPPGVDRAISNLLENARTWSPPQGLVEVRLRDGELTIRDHGPGFDEHDLPFVFDRFYRAEDARRLPGSGLGLAIVRHAAEAHGGYARAENAPGGGALLRVGFGAPLAEDAAPAR